MSVLQAESNPWIRYALLRALVDSYGEPIDLIFSQYLRHGTVNERRPALAYIDDNYDMDDIPASLLEGLEDWWLEDDTPGWIRRELMDTFASIGSGRFVDDFIDLLHDEDPALATAAISVRDELAAPVVLLGRDHPFIAVVLRRDGPGDTGE